MFSVMRQFFLIILFSLAISWGFAAQAQTADNQAELEQAKQVAVQFLTAAREGRMDDANRLVTSTAADELQAQFKSDSQRLKAAPAPEFQFALPLKTKSFAPEEYEAQLVYASKNNGKWTTTTLRLYRYDDDPYRVEFWKIDGREPNLFAMSDDPVFKRMPTVMLSIFLGMAAVGLILLFLILWLVRRKPRLVAPENEVERRVAAITRREEETTE